MSDERVDDPSERDHRYAARLDDDVVELAQVELRTELLLRLGAQPDDLAVPDLVSACLTWPCAIAIDLAADFRDARAVRLLPQDTRLP